MADFPDSTSVSKFDAESAVHDLYGASIVLNHFAEKTLPIVTNARMVIECFCSQISNTRGYFTSCIL